MIMCVEHAEEKNIILVFVWFTFGQTWCQSNKISVKGFFKRQKNEKSRVLFVLTKKSSTLHLFLCRVIFWRKSYIVLPTSSLCFSFEFPWGSELLGGKQPQLLLRLGSTAGHNSKGWPRTAKHQLASALTFQQSLGHNCLLCLSSIPSSTFLRK